jgi:hypothetical protein
VVFFFRSAVELDEAGSLVELDHVLQAEEVSVVDSDRNFLGHGDRFQPVLQEAKAVPGALQFVDL